jgi:SNF2 family DNA or RNA helicase
MPDTSLREFGAIKHPRITSSGYDFCGGTPFDIQLRTVEMLTENPRAYVLSSMGTGKTKCACWAFDYLKRTGAAKRMLVVAPLSTLRFTWLREIFQTTPHLKSVVLHGSLDRRRLLLAEPADIYIINHDGLALLEKEIIERKDIDVLVLDELAVYRNRSKRTRIAEHISRQKPTVWGMTGAPTPNSPTDVFQQAKIVTPHTVPKYFGTFRDMTMVKINQFKWVPKRNATTTAMQALRPNVRYTLDDVMELPPFISRVQDVPLGAKQMKIYNEVRKASYAMLQAGEVQAANAGAVMSKLLQISLGWVYLNDGKIAQLDGEDRIRSLVDVVASAERKVIVFVPFKHALAGVSEALTAAGISNEPVSGDTSPLERDRIFRTFQNTTDLKVLPAHPQCVAHGITLTAADTIVWFAPITSSEIYSQANARIRRVGQMHKQLFLHLQATPVERHIYKLLINKLNVQEDLLKLLEEESRTQETS